VLEAFLTRNSVLCVAECRKSALRYKRRDIETVFMEGSFVTKLSNKDDAENSRRYTSDPNVGGVSVVRRWQLASRRWLFFKSRDGQMLLEGVQKGHYWDLYSQEVFWLITALRLGGHEPLFVLFRSPALWFVSGWTHALCCTRARTHTRESVGHFRVDSGGKNRRHVVRIGDGIKHGNTVEPLITDTLINGHLQ
jgi:hypothetical protein